MTIPQAIQTLRREATRLRRSGPTVGPGVVLDHQIDSIEETLRQARTVASRRPLTRIGNGEFAEEFGADLG